MQQNYTVVTEATTASVTVEELRNHLLLFDDTSYDTELGGLILTAQRLLADEIGEYPASTTIQQTFRFFGNQLDLAHKNISTILSVQYYDQANTLINIPNTDYIFDNTSRFKKILFPTSQEQQLSSVYPYPVLVNYIAEMDPVPPTIEQAILTCAAEMWKYRYNSNDQRRFSNLINGSFLTSVLKRRIQ